MNDFNYMLENKEKTITAKVLRLNTKYAFLTITKKDKIIVDETVNVKDLENYYKKYKLELTFLE